MGADTVTVTIDLETASPAEIRRFLRPAPEPRTVTRRSSDGTELGEVGLDASIFGIEPNLAVLHQVVTAQLAAARSGTQSTKTRAEVRGGGAKPFRQKGTGRARQGSTRSPQWVGGGVALGPKPRSYAQKTPKKMIQLALRSALSDRAGQGRVALVDAWPFEVPSTKAAIASLAALGLSGRILVVLGDEDGYADRSFGNLPEVQTMVAGELNAYDILVNDWVVFTDETLPGDSIELGKAETGVDDEAAGSDTAADAADDTDTDTAAADHADDTAVAADTATARAAADGATIESTVAAPADGATEAGPGVTDAGDEGSGS
jgi:large subunit ribosomal protein L4